MLSGRCAASATFMSTSAKRIRRSPVSMLMTTTGASSASEAAGSVCGGRPSADTPPGNVATIAPDGLKSSNRFHGAGSIAMPSTFFGMASIGRATRNPVAVLESGSR